MGITRVKVKTLLLFGITIFILALLYLFLNSIFNQRSSSVEIAEKKTKGVVKEVTSLKAPPYEKMTQEVFQFRQAQIQELVNHVNSDLSAGNKISAQENLITLRDQLKQLSNPVKLAVIDQGTRQKHDPENKYIPTNETIDPEILPYYLDVIDILVRIEQESKNIE